SGLRGWAVRCGSVGRGCRAPAAPEDDGGHEEHRAGPAGQWGGPGGGPAVGAGGVRAGTEVAVAVGGRLQALRLEPVRGPQRGGGVDETGARGVVAAAGGGVAGGVRQEGLELRRGEVGVGGAQQGDGAGDERGGGTGAPALVVLAVGVGDDHVDAGGADRGVPAAGGEGRAGAVPVDGGGGDDAGVGGGVRDAVALLAAVARRGDHGDALAQRVLDGLVLAGVGVGGGGVVAEGEVDDVGAVVGGPADALGEGVAPGAAGLGPGGVAVLQDDADGQDPRLGRDTHDALGAAGAVSVAVDDPGHGGAVPGPGPVAGAGAEADQVLAGEDVAGQVGVVGVDAGVEDGDGDARALRGLPRLLGAHGLQAPLAGADAVRVGRGGGQQGECGGEQDAEGGGAAPGGAGEAHEGRSVAVRTCPRRPRSTRSARPCASCPRPAWATGPVAPDSLAASADCGSATVRPSAQPETAY